MKQIINSKALLFNLKRTMYAVMVMILALSIPLLSYMELSHTDKTQNTKEAVKENTLVTQSTVTLFQKQS